MNFPDPKTPDMPKRKPTPVINPSGSYIKEEPELELMEDTTQEKKKKRMGYKQFKVNTLKINKGKR